MFLQAEQCYHFYIETIENNLGHESPTTSNAYFTMANYYFKRGKILKAGLCYEHCKEIRLKRTSETHEGVLDCEINKSLCLLEVQKQDEAYELLKEVEKKILRTKGKNNEKIGRVYIIIAHCLRIMGRLDEADKTLKKVEKTRRKFSELEPLDVKLSNFVNRELDFDMRKEYLNNFMKNYKKYEKIKRSAMNVNDPS